MDNDNSVSRRTTSNILTGDFFLGFLALFSFAAAFSALMPTLPIYLAQSGSNEREIGVLLGIFGVSSLISRFLVGGVLRKVSEKHVMMCGAMLFALTFSAFIVFRSFWPFLTVRLFQGIAFASLDTAVMAYIIRLIPLQYRTRAISYILLAPSLATAIAASFGMFLFTRYGAIVLFLTCTGLSLCTFLFSWKWKGKQVQEAGTVAPATGSSVFEPKVIAPAITNFLQWFIWGAVVAFFPLYALQCGVMNPGIFFSANAAMIIIARGFSGMVLGAYDKEKIILTFLSTAVLALVLLSFSKSLPMFLFVGVLWGLGIAFFLPACMAYALEYAGSSNGTTVGTYQSSMDLGLALGPVIMGIVVPLTGYRIMFLCLACICTLNLCYFQFYIRRKGKAT